MSIASRVTTIVEQDQQELVDLCVEFGNTASVHGQERPMAEKVAAWLRAIGVETFLQPITEDSANVVGCIPGSGEGPSLILDAHMDTGPQMPADAPERVRRINTAWVEDGIIYGFGVANDKGQLAAFLLAIRALLRAGVRLQGDLYLA